ncbi:uncharacterized protein (TIGR02453 family) [Neolewinella xylanilytica]|uniref:Uncharacterized protein (TIGR02453 family) n=1 Tax=Neolewinella xylanilytica TaxID=1514080 RepID=A0A2S6I1H2_9BACT|nr:DUF2461 domain-containing protein [Neolewinella xylanilytica]PPK85025.1 uncharacterized protein (TIGR02453 family) [Neolewinella xylanilytica]
MSKRKIFDFLRDLSDNNSKQWMDAHRDRYEEAKAIWIGECNRILEKLASQDDFYRDIEPKDTIERINNNLLYHPERPTYKNNFGFAPGEQKGSGLYVYVSPPYSFIAGGVHNPDNGMLKKIRARIDEDGDKLQGILADKSFQDYFDGGLEEDPKMLKTSPKGYSGDHEYIDLLRRKNFTISRRITQEDVIGDDFPKVVAEAYSEMRPLLLYMREALA